MIPQTDVEAYARYSRLRHWYNKLWLSEQLGYRCGPAGIAPTVSATYVVRPIMNLVGMSARASIRRIESGDYRSVEPGHFWCEKFSGPQISVDYEWEGRWVPKSSWEATIDKDNLYKFKKWTRVHDYPELGSFYDEIADNNVQRINVEFVGGNPIEVHLRGTPDPDYDELIPIWKGEEKNVALFKELGYIYITDYDDADGYIYHPRVGFMAKNNKER